MYLYENFFKEKLQTLCDENRYRNFVHLLKEDPPYALYNGKKVVVCCSNDYLSMSTNPLVVEEAINALKTEGVGSGGTRNIAGSNNHHKELETSVADLHKQDSALLFTSGYVANETTLFTLGSHIKDVVFFSDEYNHASIVYGIKNFNKKIFKHNDTEHLESLLSSYDLNTPKIIVCVSIYSMDGDIAKIQKIAQLSKKYNALFYLDEVHAVGIYGDRGGGISELMGLSSQIDIIQGNFAKGYGVVGGYIASNKHIVDFIRSYAPGFIFTTSLPPMIAASAKKSIEILKFDRSLPKKLFEITDFFKKTLSKTNINYISTSSHIVPILIKDALLCKKFSDDLLNLGFYLQPINYPTVPKGLERFRVTLSPYHTKQMIVDLVDTLSSVIDVRKCA